MPLKWLSRTPPERSPSPNEIESGLESLRKAVLFLESIRVCEIEARFDPAVLYASKLISGGLSELFGKNSVAFKRHKWAVDLDGLPIGLFEDVPLEIVREQFEQNRRRSLEAIRDILEEFRC